MVVASRSTLFSKPILLWGITIIRGIVLALLTLLLSSVLGLTTDTLLQLGTLTIAIVGATAISRSRLPSFGILVIGGALGCGATTLLYLLSKIPFGSTGTSLFVESLAFHGFVLGIIALFSATLTVIFFRTALGSIVEALLILFSVLAVFAQGRNFRFDLVPIIDQLAWHLGVRHITLLILLGTFLAAILALYFVSCGLLRLLATESQVLRNVATGGRLLTTLIFFLLVLGASFYGVYNYYAGLSLAMISNGVGSSDDSGEGGGSGKTPLNFGDSLGRSNEAIALVRIENDYANNPTSPMLYLREEALSAYNGKELVVAAKDFDTDVPRLKHGETFDSPTLPTWIERTQVAQSVFLMSLSYDPFALDAPISLRTLSNPDSGRFRSAYRVYSYAPTLGANQIVDGVTPGDPQWSTSEREHYLKSNSNPEYKAFAERLTQGITQPTLKMRAIIEYLNKQTTYTLAPRHAKDPHGDQTAPYLFGDLRGYCVHFAHALVYMARSLGYPARIGTGFLTDLRQAKDGHLLLRASDRHAWAEVYFSPYGWIVYDLQPEKVESHDVTDVDQDTLTELMALLGQERELDKSSSATNEDLSQSLRERIFTVGHLLYTIALLLVIFISSKIYLRFLYLFSSEPIVTYRSFSALMIDLGHERLAGETRSEFLRRVVPDHSHLLPLLNLALYGQQKVSAQALVKALASDTAQVQNWKKVVSIANPLSLITLLLRKPW